jgi:hypothetical protein
MPDLSRAIRMEKVARDLRNDTSPSTEQFWWDVLTREALPPGDSLEPSGPPNIAPGTRDPLILERLAQPESLIPIIPGTQDVPETRPWGRRRRDIPKPTIDYI